jgi:hypothetical protein
MTSENHSYYGQGYNVNLDHLSKVLIAKRELGLFERHQFVFKKPMEHKPGVCPCYDCDIQMSIIVAFKGKLD